MRGTHRDVVADGIRLRVLDTGGGPATLILLHGSASHDIWEHVDRSSRTATSRRARPAGPRRIGEADAPYTIDFYAGVVRQLARELGIDHAIVAGTSLGGKIALELACWYPRFVRALVLAAPAGEYARGLRPFGKAIQALSRPGVMKIALERTLEQTFYDRTLVGHMTRRRILRARLAARRRLRARRRALGGWRARGGLAAARPRPAARARGLGP
jgi:pimeloyl-ACP methyl ester carboxylesterase